MQTSEEKSTSLFQFTKTWGIGMLLLMLALTISLSACSVTKESTNQTNNFTKPPVTDAQAKNIASSTIPLDLRYPGPSITRSIVNGITFYVGNYRAEKAGNLVIDFCFDQINTGDWIIDQSHVVDRQGLNAYARETELLEVRFPPMIIDGEAKQEILDLRGSSQEVKHYYINAEPDQKVGQRFVSVSYDLPPEFDISSFTVVVENIVAYPSESEQCSDIFVLKVQDKLNEMQTGIKIQLKTDKSAGGGMCGFEVVQKPEDISLEEAMSIAGDREVLIDLYGIRGPWIFWGGVR